MLNAALRDLQWRRRRFTIAVAGTSLVFSLTLLMAGVSAGFGAEASGTVRDLGADVWVVRTGAAGPFLGSAAMAQTEAELIAAQPGVELATPTAFNRKSVRGDDGSETDVNLFGAVPDGVGFPEPDSGRRPSAPGEAVISTRLGGYDLGDTVTIAGHPLTVVGKIRSSTALGGAPNVFLSLADAQAVGFAGLPVATAIAVRGEPTSLPDGYVAVDNDVAKADLLRAIAKAKSSITLISVLLWLVAASIIGLVVYLSALERQRDFAVFKATGVATPAILGGLALQAAIMAISAAVIGSVIASLLGPRFPMIVSIERGDHLLLPLLAVTVGLVASIAGIRRVITVDPALAFGGP